MITEQVKKDSVMDSRKTGKVAETLRIDSLRKLLRLKRSENQASSTADMQQDLIYQGRDVDLRKIPIAREMYLKKKDTVLGKRFKKTLLGYTKGALNQYRGPHSTHVREYSDHYTIHRDFIDPRRNPISHLAKDAPMELAGWVIGALIALILIVFVIF